jgi:hypothetical protein
MSAEYCRTSIIECDHWIKNGPANCASALPPIHQTSGKFREPAQPNDITVIRFLRPSKTYTFVVRRHYKFFPVHNWWLGYYASGRQSFDGAVFAIMTAAHQPRKYQGWT